MLLKQLKQLDDFIAFEFEIRNYLLFIFSKWVNNAIVVLHKFIAMNNRAINKIPPVIEFYK